MLKFESRPIQIQVVCNQLVALCEDGTLWRREPFYAMPSPYQVENGWFPTDPLGWHWVPLDAGLTPRWVRTPDNAIVSQDEVLKRL